MYLLDVSIRDLKYFCVLFVLFVFLFMLLALLRCYTSIFDGFIVYFVHRKYCAQKAAAKPDDQPSSTAPATMIPTAPMPLPSIMFPLQQHLSLQQPFHIQPPINYPWGYPQQTASNMLPLPALFPRQTPQFTPATRSQIRPANPTSADAQIERNNEEEPIGEATDGVAREFNKDIPYGQRYI